MSERKPVNMFWGEKRYHSLDYHLKKIYGSKVQKISLDAGMTCPTRDGTKGTRGCIFCSAMGSGDFSAGQCGSITEQIDKAILNMSPNKKCGGMYIAYFQSFTNTYAPVDYLRKIFFEAISHDKIAGISIATRPDCISKETTELLCELQQIKPVWVELGLQTIHEDTARFIRRGYTLDVFEQTVSQLSDKSIDIIVHVILGLPHETNDEIIETIEYIAHSPVSGIKLQLLHVLKNTDLVDYYGTFHIFSEDEYTDLVIECLEHLPEDMVIHRLTGDGPSNLLIAPLWSLKKRSVLNTINRKLKEKNTWQGRLYKRTI